MVKENIRVPLDVLEIKGRWFNFTNEYGEVEKWTAGESETSLEIEDEKIIIPFKITKFDSESAHKGGKRWERAGREYVAYTPESYEITLFEKIIRKEPPLPQTRTTFQKEIVFPNKEKKIKIVNLRLVWKDEKNEITNIDDYFPEGAEVKLKLVKNPEEDEETGKIPWQLRELGDWKEEGNDIFSLEVYSDYEIITADGKTISFANSLPKENIEEEENNTSEQTKTPQKKGKIGLWIAVILLVGAFFWGWKKYYLSLIDS